MPAVSYASQDAQTSSRRFLISPLSPWTVLQVRLALFLLLGFSVAGLVLLRRFINHKARRSLRPTQSQITPPALKKTDTLESTWPPASLVALAPESNNLPTPTIRRTSPPSADPVPSSPQTFQRSKTKSWPTSGGLLRRETMEEVNGCRRHVMVFGRQGNWGR